MRTIDCSGPEGNVFFLIATARRLAKALDLDVNAIQEDMMSSEYNHDCDVFEEHFDGYVRLVNK